MSIEIVVHSFHIIYDISIPKHPHRNIIFIDIEKYFENK